MTKRLCIHSLSTLFLPRRHSWEDWADYGVIQRCSNCYEMRYHPEAILNLQKRLAERDDEIANLRLENRLRAMAYPTMESWKARLAELEKK